MALLLQAADLNSYKRIDTAHKQRQTLKASQVMQIGLEYYWEKKAGWLHYTLALFNRKPCEIYNLYRVILWFAAEAD